MKGYLNSIVDILSFIGLRPAKQIGYQIFLVLCFTISELIGVLLLIAIINFLLFQNFETLAILDKISRFGLSKSIILTVLIFMFLVRFLITRAIISLQLKAVYALLHQLNTFLFSVIVTSKNTIKTEDVLQCSVIETNNICIGFYMQFIRAVSELIFLSILAIWVVTNAPLFSALLISLFGIAMYFLQFYNKKILLRSGATRVTLDEKRTSLLEFSSNSSIELSGYGVEHTAIKKFSDIMNEYCSLGLEQQKIKGMQKYWIETIFILSLFLSSLVSLTSKYFQLDIITSGPLLAAAALKILPGVNRLTSYFNAMHFYKSSVAKYVEFLKNVKR